MDRLWQVSAGLANRRYAEVFLRIGVALIGPGDAGPWRPERSDADFEGSYVRRFAVDARVGDPVVLRIGTSRIAAVGLFAGERLRAPCLCKPRQPLKAGAARLFERLKRP